ncbi:hypothetical protein LCGC14_0970190 [marine sediment metagenome]|uniref:Uncharacterized protein n=1 Tax=marine sediment metagenome TaxID=412755 RepID=A0A0F9QV22_9ZZZZ
MRKGELQTTQDINQKFLMNELNGNEVWAFEEKGILEVNQRGTGK